MNYLSLKDAIDTSKKYINTGAESAETAIKDSEKEYEKIMKKDKMITEKNYLRYHAQIDQRLRHANNVIEYFNEEKSNIIQKAKDHIDNILEKNEHIKTIAEKALVKLNAKYIKPQNLQSLSAHILKSQGVTADDLPSPEKGVFERITDASTTFTLGSSSKGGKQNRKTKKCLMNVGIRSRSVR